MGFFFDIFDLIFTSIWIVPTIFVVLLIYILGSYSYDTFSTQGVKYEKPWPYFGNMLEIVLKKKAMCEVLQSLYEKFSSSRFFGLYEFVKPTYVICDPELIKQICIKDFDYFVNHRGQFDELLDPLFSRNMFTMKDNKWRNMRSVLSPAFTGSKMRLMFELLAKYCDKAVKNVHKGVGDEVQDFQMKDLFTRFATDIIATSSFGIEVDSLKNRENEFYLIGKKLTNWEGTQGLKMFGFSSMPKIMKLLRIKLFDDVTIDFLRALVWDTIRYREKNNVIRHDMINLLIQAKNHKLKVDDNEKQYGNAGFATVTEYDMKATDKATKWTEDDFTAQCMIFFFGGFDTASTLMMFVAYELSRNPSVQDVLRNEIDGVRKDLKGSPLTYEIIQQMKYLDNVVSETLRKWPPVIANDRICSKPYTMRDYNGTKVQLKEGDGLWLPIHAIHNDPKYFPNPEKFDPERFSDENKNKIDPATYMPFGMGPRNCVSSRFALMETKAIIFYLLSSFILEESEKTQGPLQIVSKYVLLAVKEGIWLKLRPRKEIL